MEFNETLKDATKYLNENTQDPKLKKATELMLERFNTPKKDYTGVQNYINGSKAVNSAKLGTSSPNDVLSNIFGSKNKLRDEEMANKKAMEEKAKVDAENKAVQDEENAKNDRMKRRKMHQQALVSSRTGEQKQPPIPQGNMMAMGM